MGFYGLLITLWSCVVNSGVESRKFRGANHIISYAATVIELFSLLR